MDDQVLFSHKEDFRNSLPNYEDFALVSKRIIHALKDRKPGDWKHIDIGETIVQLDPNLLEMMEKNLLPYESLAYIFETKPVGKIMSKSKMSTENKLEIVETFENKLIYFPDYDVALTLAFNFSASHSWPEYHFFSVSVEKALLFLDEINEKLRQLLMQSITYLVDTENGVQRRNYGEQAVVNREDVLLTNNIKQDIFRSIDEFFKEDGHFFKDYGLPYKRGILLYGSPGNGKTTLVKSITGSTKAPVVYWQITEFTGSHSIQEVFGIVTRLAPAILVIEDIDSMPEYTRSVFLNTLDGVQSREGLFIIGTTNYPQKIDPALINRAGRFDRAYEIPSPPEKLREQYLRKLDIKHIFTDEQFADMARRSKGLSMSQLNELYMSVALNWHYDGKLAYESRIEELIKQNKRSIKNEWETDDNSIGFG
ncbi:ATP-binding protein [Psychrobacillus vulpis]|uniref:ATP-binding protein n=1 Tax=Psychrobacillus vulpis TaxID=2325572 RepID=A0A544TQ32_9BACI|nr:ATP-binding protein [Psychrobacillus vulpis]TQR19563.1 ATP-binding protein [Psychrobacillus vulpis]